MQMVINEHPFRKSNGPRYFKQSVFKVDIGHGWETLEKQRGGDTRLDMWYTQLRNP